jgi:outer membrane receptor for ferrienterochelin and colicin
LNRFIESVVIIEKVLCLGRLVFEHWLSDGKAAMSSHKYPRERLISFFGRANYSYKDRYMLTGSVRHEGSSKFGKNHRWGTFWAVSGGWRISNEAFLRDVSFLDDSSGS